MFCVPRVVYICPVCHLYLCTYLAIQYINSLHFPVIVSSPLHYCVSSGSRSLFHHFAAFIRLAALKPFRHHLKPSKCKMNVESVKTDDITFPRPGGCNWTG